jgi:hypothetical protein
MQIESGEEIVVEDGGIVAREMKMYRGPSRY